MVKGRAPGASARYVTFAICPAVASFLGGVAHICETCMWYFAQHLTCGSSAMQLQHCYLQCCGIFCSQHRCRRISTYGFRGRFRSWWAGKAPFLDAAHACPCASVYHLAVLVPVSSCTCSLGKPHAEVVTSYFFVCKLYLYAPNFPHVGFGRHGYGKS